MSNLPPEQMTAHSGTTNEVAGLRAELEQARERTNVWKQAHDDAQVRLEQEREDHAKYAAWWHDQFKDVEAELEQARKQVERLEVGYMTATTYQCRFRDALEWIANRYRNDDDTEARQIARDALAGDK